MADATASARETLRQLIMGFQPPRLIGVAARFGLADLLANGPRSSVELAELGVFAMLDDHSFALTPLGTYLRTDVPDSLHAAALLWSDEFMQRPWLALPHTVRTGETAFDYVFGMNLFEYLTAHPETAEVFNNGMTGQFAQVTAAVVGSYDFSLLRGIVDVGGGNGTMIAAILQAHPESRGVIFDLPHCRESALRSLAADGLADRGDFVGGDFFEAVPAGADAYLLRNILHDWDDLRSVAILRTCRHAMAPGSKLLLIERLLAAGNEPRPDVVFADLNMLVGTGGRERTEAEYRALLREADLSLVRIIPTPSAFSVVEAEPVTRADPAR